MKTTDFEIDLREHLSYNHITGDVRWIKSPKARVKVGDIAGSLTPKGWRLIRFRGELMQYSHVAWFLYYGVWPTLQIDHKDRRRDNNCIKNLREATPVEQARNRNVNCNNKLGIKGVSRQKGSENHTKPYRAHINGKLIGCFASIEEAKAAREAKEKELFGSFSTV